MRSVPFRGTARREGLESQSLELLLASEQFPLRLGRAAARARPSRLLVSRQKAFVEEDKGGEPDEPSVCLDSRARPLGQVCESFARRRWRRRGHTRRRTISDSEPSASVRFADAEQRSQVKLARSRCAVATAARETREEGIERNLACRHSFVGSTSFFGSSKLVVRSDDPSASEGRIDVQSLQNVVLDARVLSLIPPGSRG